MRETVLRLIRTSVNNKKITKNETIQDINGEEINQKHRYQEKYWEWNEKLLKKSIVFKCEIKKSREINKTAEKHV